MLDWARWFFVFGNSILACASITWFLPEEFIFSLYDKKNPSVATPRKLVGICQLKGLLDYSLSEQAFSWLAFERSFKIIKLLKAFDLNVILKGISDVPNFLIKGNNQLSFDRSLQRSRTFEGPPTHIYRHSNSWHHFSRPFKRSNKKLHWMSL